MQAVSFYVVIRLHSHMEHRGSDFLHANKASGGMHEKYSLQMRLFKQSVGSANLAHASLTAYGTSAYIMTPDGKDYVSSGCVAETGCELLPSLELENDAEIPLLHAAGKKTEVADLLKA